MKRNILFKKTVTIVIGFFISSIVFSQVPQGLNYQAVLRNASGQILQNHNVTMKFTVHKSTPNGDVIYEEIQGPIQTNNYGLLNLQIGQGTPTVGTFSSINWGNYSFFLQVLADIGTGFINLGTTQFMSVPYAMVADTVLHGGGGGSGTVTDIGTGIGLTGGPITSSGTISIANTGVTANTYGNLTNYPSLTINAQGQITTASSFTLPISLPPNGPAVGDLSGSYPSPTVAKIQSVAINNIPPTIGQVLTYNGSNWGPASPSSNNGWSLTGNAGTNSVNNFIGTTDLQPLDFRTNNILKTRITTKGQLETYNTGNSVFIGQVAGANDDLTSNQNVYIGDSVGYSSTTGYGNNALGYLALRSNIGGFQNIAIGKRALYSNTDGHNNVALGHRALEYNTIGSNNVSVGYISLSSNINGNYNTASGYGSLHSNMAGNNNTANGYNALYSNIDGNHNTATGDQALQSNTTGDENVAIGYKSLNLNNSDLNTAIGSNALRDNTDGYSNTALGRFALVHNIDGDNNNAIGSALGFNTTGNSNIGIGTYALDQNTSGNNNTACGSQALEDNTTGSNNTALGYNAYSNGTAYSNSMALGYSAMSITDNNMVRIGNSAITSIGGKVGWSSLSDERLKSNVQNNVPGLDFIMKLSPVTYYFDINKENEISNTGENTTWKGKNDLYSVQFTGFLAQDVDAAAKEIGYNFSGVDRPKNAEGLWGLRYAEFTVPLVKAVQEQQSLIEELKKQIEIMQAQIDKLQNNK